MPVCWTPWRGPGSSPSTPSACRSPTRRSPSPGPGFERGSTRTAKVNGSCSTSRRRARVGPPSGATMPSSTGARADQARQLETQARTNRRLRRLLTGVALALVVTLVAGTFALVQRSRASRAADRAERQAEVADATRLGAQAVALAGKRPDLALNL